MSPIGIIQPCHESLRPSWPIPRPRHSVTTKTTSPIITTTTTISRIPVLSPITPTHISRLPSPKCQPLHLPRHLQQHQHPPRAVQRVRIHQHIKLERLPSSESISSPSSIPLHQVVVDPSFESRRNSANDKKPRHKNAPGEKRSRPVERETSKKVVLVGY